MIGAGLVEAMQALVAAVDVAPAQTTKWMRA